MPQTINATTALGNVGAPSYGGMYYNGAGSTVTVTTAGTYYGFVDASTGAVAGTGYVTFDNNATADRLTVGANGAGTYYVSVSCSFNGPNSAAVEGAIFLDGVEQPKIEFKRTLGSSAAVGSASCAGFLTLAVGQYVDFRLTSGSNGDAIVVKVLNVTITRIG